MLQPDYERSARDESIARSFAAMRRALKEIVFNEGGCMREDETRYEGAACECAVCIAKAALAGEEDWRFEGSRPARRATSPREAAIHAAWKHYFVRSAGMANGTTAPMDAILSQILFGSESPGEITPRDWYVATTVVQWLATNVGQCILNDAGYVRKDGL